MRFTLASFAVVLALFLGAWPVSAKSQRDEGRLVNNRSGTATTLPNFSENQQGLVDAMSDEFYAARTETSDPGMQLLLKETEAFALQIEALYYASVSEDWSHEELDERSNDIEETTHRLTDLVNAGSEPPQINVAPLPAEDYDVRIGRLVNLSRRLIPSILFLVGADAVNLDLLNQIRDDLAITGALSAALPESTF